MTDDPLVQEMLDRYTLVSPTIDTPVDLPDDSPIWGCWLQIDHQTFGVVEDTERSRAEWFARQLAIALARLVRSHGGSVRPPGPGRRALESGCQDRGVDEMPERGEPLVG